MAEASRHDAWQAGDRYEAYMGRWSRQIAPRFLDWLGAAGRPRLAGRGLRDRRALRRDSGAVQPEEPAGDRSFGRLRCDGQRRRCRIARASSNGRRPGAGRASASKDAIVSGLVLNFVPDRPKALAEMKRVARAGGDGRRSMSGITPAAAWSSCAPSGTAAAALDPPRGAERGQAVSGLHARRPDCLAKGAGLRAWSARRSRCRPCSAISRTTGTRSRWARGRRRATARASLPRRGSA